MTNQISKLTLLVLEVFSVPLSAQRKLVWCDEFEKEGKPDPAKWRFEKGFVRNNELQWFSENNAYCKEGLLIIEARKEILPNPDYQGDSKEWRKNRKQAEYTSASITTRGLYDFRYGVVEMRAKIDTRPGLWPAFWTLGVKEEWPSNGELDIMEYYRGTLLANAAWGSKTRWKAQWNTVKTPIAEFNDPDWADKFHIWRTEWDEKSIRILLDGKLISNINLENTYNENNPNFNPFRQNHYLLLTMALGGDNGGDPSGTSFPARFEIDYVRVYQ